MNNFTRNFSKCNFWVNEILFLGHNISKDGISVESKQP